MKIGVLGAGAIGSTIGGHLAEAGFNVTLIDIWREHVESINSKGLHLFGVSGDRYIRVKATTSAKNLEKMDMVILSVKAYDTKVAIQSASNIFSKDTILISLQNGLIPQEDFRAIPGLKYIFRGVTNQGATVVGPGEVYHAGSGPTYIGDPSKMFTDKAKEAVDIFNKAGLEAYFEPDIDSIIWSKLLVNIGINAITAITRKKNEAVARLPELLEVMQLAVSEAMDIVNKLGIELMYKDPFTHIMNVALKTGNNKSSMLQDIERGRKTEIDYINGAIVRLGEELGIPTPINKVLTLLVRSLEYRNSLNT